jgi:type IV pilus assembly protein PilA
LAVTLIIGVLAAIAVPAFTGQQSKAEDASAQSNARNVVAAVASCFTDTNRYDRCDTLPELQATGQNAVSITATASTYSVVGYSATHGEFAIER